MFLKRCFKAMAITQNSSIINPQNIISMLDSIKMLIQLKNYTQKPASKSKGLTCTGDRFLTVFRFKSPFTLIGETGSLWNQSKHLKHLLISVKIVVWCC